MDMLNTGHLGFAIREGDFTLRVDPLLPVNGCFGPARYAAESQLPPADCIAVTSPHPFNSSGASLRELAGEAPVIGSRSCVASLRGVERKRLHELPADATVSLGPVQLTSLPGSNGDTLLLSNGEDSLWLLGPSAVSISTALAAFARTGKGRARVVLSGYLDCPSEVACGGARNFPERAHQQLLDTARALRIAGFSKLLVAGGVRFRGTSDWLNAFAEALPLEDVCEDIQAFCADTEVEALRVGQWYGAPEGGLLPTCAFGQTTAFDPTLGIPDLPHVGAAHADAGRMLESRLARALRASWWPTLAMTTRAWNSRLAIREVSAQGERWWSVALGHTPRVSAGYDPLAGAILALTAPALVELFEGTATAHELSLRGELRSFSRAYRLRGSAVQVPEQHRSGLCRLASPLDLLEALCSSATAVAAEEPSP